APHSASRLLVRAGTRDLLIDANDVDWIEADDYCAILHVGRATYVLRETLSSLEQRLDPRMFVRVHRSTIVNLSRVRELARHPLGGMSVVLKDGTRLPLSRGRREKLLAAIGTPR